MRTTLSWCLVLLVIVTFFSCKTESEKKEDVQEDSTFKMYEMSALASLMEQMHAQAVFLKANIELGNTDLGEWPVKHNQILTAEMTDASDRDIFFEYQASEYLKLEQVLYLSKEENKKKQFNNMINSCLACHQKKCGGPIPRIKKLLIN